MHYLTRLSHFTFKSDSDADEIVVTGERDDSFERRYDWPDGLSADDDSIEQELHERYYIELQNELQ